MTKINILYVFCILALHLSLAKVISLDVYHFLINISHYHILSQPPQKLKYFYLYCNNRFMDIINLLMSVHGTQVTTCSRHATCSRHELGVRENS